MVYLCTKDGYIKAYRKQTVKEPKIPKILTKAERQAKKRLKKLQKKNKQIKQKPVEMEDVLRYKESSKIKSFNQKEIIKISFSEGYLATIDIKTCVRVYDVIEKDVQPVLVTVFFSDDESQKDAKLIEGFDLHTIQGQTILFVFYNKVIETYLFKVDGGYEQWKEPIQTDIKISSLYYIREEQIVIASKDTNIYLAQIQNNQICEQKLIRESQVNTECKGLLYVNGIVTIVISDNMQNQTVVSTIDMELLAEEEALELQRIEEMKKYKALEKEMQEKLTDDEFQMWKHRQQQIQQQKAAEQAAQEAKNKKEKKLTAKMDMILEIGKCSGVTITKSKDQLLVSGTTGIQIFENHRWRTKKYEIVTDFKIVRAFLSSDEQFLLAVGTDGTLREVQYRGEKKNSILAFIEESEIQDAVSTGDGRFFALLSKNQTTLSIYSYENCKKLYCDNDLEYAYLLEFTANCQALICVMGTENPKDFEAVIYSVSTTKPCEKIESTFLSIEEEYITSVQASIQKEQIYAIGKSNLQQCLYIYAFGDPVCRRVIRDAISLSLSSDEKLLAYSTKAAQVLMLFVKKTEEKKRPAETQQEPPKRKTLFMFAQPVEVDEDFPFEEDEPVNTIDMPDMAYSLCFYDSNQKIVVQTNSCIIGYDIYTHNQMFKVIASLSNNELKKLNVLFDNFVTFSDGNGCVTLIDFNYNLGSEFIYLSTKSLKCIELQYNSLYQKMSHTAYAGAGNHIILQTKDGFAFEANPFLHHRVNNETTHSGPFQRVEGFFVPVLLGGPQLSIGSFAAFYLYAIEDITRPVVSILQTPIFPYRLNSMHYFAMTGNVEGVEICFKNKVKFIKDIFGKTPLDYAIKTSDKLVIEAILKGIYETENEEKIKIMRTLKLDLLLKYPAAVLSNLLGQNGTQSPEVAKFAHELEIPTLFPLQENLFSESGLPIYSAEVAKQLHPPKLFRKTNKKRPISTIVLNNPVPNNFTKQSLSLLSSIVSCSNDDIVRTVPITLYLNRKWNSFGYPYYLLQFVLYVILLMSLALLDSLQLINNDYVFYTNVTITLLANTYFFLYEVVQMIVQKTEYLEPQNIFDLVRLGTIYMYIYHRLDPTFIIPDEILPIVFLLMWFKIISFLSVFKPTRYLIKMIYEIIRDIQTFLIILFSALFAYAQINYSLVPIEERDIDQDLRSSYVLSLGELGDFDQLPYLSFFVFMSFSFLIPLVLMNMVIALMGDSYTRVQTNAIAADARALAEMELEMEQVVYSLLMMFKPNLIKTNFYYCFQTSINDADGDEDWEGTVGQLKRTIEEATENLEVSLIGQIQGMQKKSTEKIVDNLLRANKSELEALDKLNKLVEKESTTNREHLEEKLLEEGAKVKKQFDQTHQQMHEESKHNTNQFNQNQKNRDEHHQRMLEEFRKTNSWLDKELNTLKCHIDDEFSETKNEIKCESTEIKQIQRDNHNNLMNRIQKESEHVEQEFQVTYDKIHDTQKQLDQESTNLKVQMKDTLDNITNQFNETQQQLDTRATNLDKEVNKAQNMVQETHDEMNQQCNEIKDKVFESTNITKNNLLQKIDHTSYNDSLSIQQQFLFTKDLLQKQETQLKEQMEINQNQVQELFNKTQKQLEEVSQTVYDHFEKTYVKLTDESSTVQEKVKETKEKLVSETHLFKQEFHESQKEQTSRIFGSFNEPSVQEKKGLMDLVKDQITNTQEMLKGESNVIQTQAKNNKDALENYISDISKQDATFYDTMMKSQFNITLQVKDTQEQLKLRDELKDKQQAEQTRDIKETTQEQIVKAQQEILKTIKGESSSTQQFTKSELKITHEDQSKTLELIKQDVRSTKDQTKLEIEKSTSEITTLVRDQFSKQYETGKIEQTSAQAELKKILMDEIKLTKDTIKNESTSIQTELGKAVKSEVGKALFETTEQAKKNHNESTKLIKEEIIRIIEINKQEATQTQNNLAQMIKDTSFQTDTFVKQFGNATEEELKKINLVLGMNPPSGSSQAPAKAASGDSGNQLVNYILESQKKVADLIAANSKDQSTILKTITDLKDSSSGSNKIVPFLNELKDNIIEQGKLVKQTNEFAKTGTDTGKLLGIMQELQESAQESSKIIKSINDLKDTTVDQGKLLKTIYDVQKASDTGRLLKVVNDLQDTAKEQSKLVGVIQDLKQATSGQTQMPTKIQSIQDMSAEQNKLLKQILDLSKASSEQTQLVKMLQDLKNSQSEQTKHIIESSEKLKNQDGPNNTELAKMIQEVKEISNQYGVVLNKITENTTQQMVILEETKTQDQEQLTKNFLISEEIKKVIEEIQKAQIEANQKQGEVADVAKIGSDPEKMAQFLLMIKNSIDNQRGLLQKISDMGDNDQTGNLIKTLKEVKEQMQEQNEGMRTISDIRNTQVDQGMTLDKVFTNTKQLQDQTRLFSLINELKMYALDHTRLLKILNESQGSEMMRSKSNVEQGKLSTVEELVQQEIKHLLEKNQSQVERLVLDQSKLLTDSSKIIQDQTSVLNKVDEIRNKFSLSLKHQEKEFSKIGMLEEKQTTLLQSLDKKQMENMMTYERKFNESIDIIEKKVTEVLNSPERRGGFDSPERQKSPDVTAKTIEYMIQPQLINEASEKKQDEAIGVINNVLSELRTFIAKFEEKSENDKMIQDAREKKINLDQRKFLELLEKIYKFELQNYSQSEDIISKQNSSETKFAKDMKSIGESLEKIFNLLRNL